MQSELGNNFFAFLSIIMINAANNAQNESEKAANNLNNEARKAVRDERDEEYRNYI
jgi:hypothetical protein